MVWQPRIGAAADSPPKLFGTSDLREGNWNAANAHGLQTSRGFFDPTGFRAEWTDSALYVWGASSQPTIAELQQNASVAVLKLPPEIEGQSSQLLYQVEALWPENGQYPALLGLFIYSRPAGSTSWRAGIDYRPFSPEIEATKGTNEYRASLATVPADEYQLRTRWAWQPPGEDIKSDVLIGAEVPGVLFLLLAEMLSPTGKAISTVGSENAVPQFIDNRFYSIENRTSASAQGAGGTFQDDRFFSRVDSQSLPDLSNAANNGRGQAVSAYTDGAYLLFLG